jgi:hypothetical protein
MKNQRILGSQSTLGKLKNSFIFWEPLWLSGRVVMKMKNQKIMAETLFQ